MSKHSSKRDSKKCHKHAHKHDHKHKHNHTCLCKEVPLPPWSETRMEPDAQWCPTVPIRYPLNVVNVPFNSSSEEPDAQWADNIIIKSAKCHHKFLKKSGKDTIERYVYGRNPFTDTVCSGGSHFQ